MPIKNDDAGNRWVEMELLVPGTPEQVWQAMATGAGNSAWFTRTQIEERVGGALLFDLGPHGSSAGEIVTWEPPFRFGYIEREWNEDAPPVATEITVTARAGERCVVRMVHSLFTTSDEWDDQIEGFENGWPGFFEVLRVYLAHFAGREAASFSVLARSVGEQSSVWSKLTAALGLAGVNVGETCSAPPGSLEFAGVVEHVRQDAKQRYVVVRLHAPAAGVALVGSYGTGGQCNASVALYLYGDAAGETAAGMELQWNNWLADATAA